MYCKNIILCHFDMSCGLCLGMLENNEGERCPCGTWFCWACSCERCPPNAHYVSASEVQQAEIRRRRTAARHRQRRARTLRRMANRVAARYTRDVNRSLPEDPEYFMQF